MRCRHKAMDQNFLTGHISQRITRCIGAGYEIVIATRKKAKFLKLKSEATV